MDMYINKNENFTSPAVVLDDMILTTDLPTTAGSKMLDGYVSLFAAEAADKLAAAGYSVSGKANVGELSIDLLGETSYKGACTDENGNLAAASAEIVKSGEVEAAINLDVNGMPRRAAALSGLVFVKPTYGTVSRFGTIPAACSGETVGVMAKTVDGCRKVLDIIVGHDNKDGTTHSEEKCAMIKSAAGGKAAAKVAVLTAFTNGLDSETAARLDAFKAALSNNGIELCEVEAADLLNARAAWNVLMSAELCNNVSRYDGVKYGYRTPNYTNIDELYTNSRTEAFGELLKTAILFGSDVLSTENYQKVYDKALRIRRVICESLEKLLGEYDALLLPACSKAAYSLDDVKQNSDICFEENLYTAPASISGLPTVVAGGMQLIGKAFSESTLFGLAKTFEKEAAAK